MYLQVEDVLALHERGIQSWAKPSIARTEWECGRKSTFLLASRKVDPGAEVSIRLAVTGANKGQQDGRRANMRGDRCGRECRRGESRGWDVESK